MPLTDAIAALLAVNRSPTAQALRWSLHGLLATLQAAQREALDDPGAGACTALVQTLAAFLHDRAGAPAVTGAAPGPGRPPAATPAPACLPQVRAVMLADPGLNQLLGTLHLPEEMPRLWQDMQRLLLRLPLALAHTWWGRAQAAAQKDGCRPAPVETAIVLPLAEAEEICPGLCGAVTIPGLRSDPAAPLDPRLGPPSGPDALGRIISAWLRLIEWDPTLHHALKTVYRFGTRPLRDSSGAYTAELLARYQRSTAADNPAATLRALLDLDEAIHSLVHIPPAQPGSWWERVRREARQALYQAAEQARTASVAVVLTELAGPYADVHRLSEDDVELTVGGEPGEVVACLRVHARIDGQQFPGRVLYRAARRGR